MPGTILPAFARRSTTNASFGTYVVSGFRLAGPAARFFLTLPVNRLAQVHVPHLSHDLAAFTISCAASFPLEPDMNPPGCVPALHMNSPPMGPWYRLCPSWGRITAS